MSSPAVMVISGPSGVGKSTLIGRLLNEPGFRLAVSATSRDPRPGEQNGREYHFVSAQQFLEMRERDEFIEWAEVYGRYYGTPRSELLRGDQTVILDVDVQGWRSVRKLGLGAVGIFITAPSLAHLERRLRQRRSESEESLERRLAGAAAEMAASHEYDHVIVNDGVEKAFAELKDLAHRISRSESRGRS